MKLRRVAARGHAPQKAGWLGTLNPAVDRRKLLAAAGVGLGAAALAPTLVRQSKAAEGAQGGKVEQIKTICSNCSVGCGFTGVVQDGVWVSQDPWSSIRSIAAACAPRARPRASTASARSACATP